MSVMRIGAHAKAYYGTAGSSATTELTTLKEVSWGEEATEVTGGDRGSAFVVPGKGLRKLRCDLTFSGDSSNAGYAAVLAAARASGESGGNPAGCVSLKFLDHASGSGVEWDWMVFTFQRSEPLEGEIAPQFTCVGHPHWRDAPTYL